MKRLLTIFVVYLFVLQLSGCSKDTQLSGGVKQLEVLLNDTDVLVMSIPTELSIVKQDNSHYFEFTDDVGIYRMTSTTSTAEKDEKTGLFIGTSSVIRNFDNCSVVINCKEPYKTFFKSTLADARVIQKDALPYKEYAMKSLPSYSEAVDMELVGDMYMPPNCEDVLYDIYNSKLYTSGSEWLQSIIVDSKLEDLRPRLITLATLNSGSKQIKGWYESDDIFYCYTDICIVGAKKLAYNSWYVYTGSPSMQNYILTGISKVRGQSK